LELRSCPLTQSDYFWPAVTCSHVRVWMLLLVLTWSWQGKAAAPASKFHLALLQSFDSSINCIRY